MKQGRFEAGRRETPETEQPRRRFDWLMIAVPILVLGALGLANLWLAVFGDVGVSVLAILNSMRTLRE